MWTQISFLIIYQQWQSHVKLLGGNVFISTICSKIDIIILYAYVHQIVSSLFLTHASIVSQTIEFAYL